MSEPVARKEYLDGLEALPPSFTSELWTKVHHEVQEQLVSLETEVRREVPEVRVHTGRTKGDKFLLFSYRTFSMPDSALDPVVVGMLFTPAHRSVIVDADVSGEQTGDMILSMPIKTVANSREELLPAARESARTLCQSAQAIISALQNPCRRLD